MADSKFLVLGGGCFWCTEAVYEKIDGVVSVVSGYAGGSVPNPTYDQVVSGTTGHAEVIRVEYDPARVSFRQLVDLFWSAHDPTTLNRQGYDTGTQYRSIVFFQNSDEEQDILASREGVKGFFDDPIVTEVVQLNQFYPAEGYHQDFYALNPSYGYCQVVIAPKMRKLGLEAVEKIAIPDMTGIQRTLN
ncbi:MAG: peptide-methionine (S)-S-oxide reductase MsrA [Spirochaetales bacterium]|nr:peptide-methionine (S)-S-oxide reductase MsrA [Spirochaetales bacterium]